MSLNTPIPGIILAIVLILIAVRRIRGFRVRIWHAMTFGAVAVLITGQIDPFDALLSINVDIILFLFGMFVVSQALVKSGFLDTVALHAFRRARSVSQLIILILVIVGILSAVLINDAMAIIGTPIALSLARKHKINPKLLLLALAMAITTGSVMSPVGNPQNLLVATGSEMAAPFVTFFQFLAVPSFIGLVLVFVVLRIFYRQEFSKPVEFNDEIGVRDPDLARIAKASLMLVVMLILAKAILAGIAPWVDFRLTYIALVASIPVLIASSRRVEIAKSIDWGTLVFFVSMFILTASVWKSGIIQLLIDGIGLDVTAIPVIMILSVLLSQVIFNVPLVALYMPLLIYGGATTAQYLALAASSTIAGNMFILGAASNVIVIQNAEKDNETITFLEFARIGVPLTALQLIVYTLFLVVSL